MKLTQESKKELFKNFGGAETNTGSTEAQVALFTQRINHISEHLKTNRKDFSSTRALTMMVGKRKKLLAYLAKKDINRYRELIKELNLRR